MYFLKPSNLIIEDVMKENKNDLIMKNLNSDKLLYICHALITARSNNRKQMLQKGTSYANLNAKMLEEVVNNQNEAVRFLRKAGVIETNGQYVVGTKSRGYRFSGIYDGQPIEKVGVKSYTIRKAMRRFSQKLTDEYKSKMQGYKYVTKWWDSARLSIDAKGANQWIDKYQESQLSIEKNLYNRRQIINTCEDFKILVSKFDDGKFGNIHFDDSGHRLYTLLTGMKRELRGFVKFDDQYLVNLDLKSSQPYLSIKLFDKSVWLLNNNPDKLKLRDLDNYIYKHIKSNKVIFNNIIMFLDSLESQYGKGFQNENSFISLVTSGLFYEYLMDKLQNRFPKRFFDRNMTKRETLRILYFDPEKENHRFYKPSIAFRDLFPLEYGLFKEIKQIQYNYLPIILQRIESYLIIDCICKNISRMNPNIPLFTIHDSIATLEEFKDIVQNEMIKVLEEQIGHPPKIGIEYFRDKLMN